MQVRQWSKKRKEWVYKEPCPNTKVHEKGILGHCTYLQVSLSVPHQPTRGIPLHRIIYAWFNDTIPAYNENNEKMEVCHKGRFEDPTKDSHILNLYLDTAKNNRAARKGARNQHDTPRLEAYGLDALITWRKKDGK